MVVRVLAFLAALSVIAACGQPRVRVVVTEREISDEEGEVGDTDVVGDEAPPDDDEPPLSGGDNEQPTGDDEPAPTDDEPSDGDSGAEAGHARYGVSTHSPLTTNVVARLRALREAHPELQDDVFAKIGASNTVNPGFATCFDNAGIALVDRAELEEVRAHFAAGDAAGESPYDRVSSAATVGWSSGRPLAGSPRPLDIEIDAIAPAYGLVMFGTNDIQQNNIARYADDMLALVDAMLARGVIPLVSAIPPRTDDAAADVQVRRYNLVARLVAEARQVPFMDLEARLRPIVGFGLGPDGIHMNRDPRGGCIFDDEGLTYGFNQRNALTLEALDRVVRAVSFAEAAPDRAPAAVAGDGSPARPFVVDALPFAHVADTSTSPHSARASYACAPGTDESGPELTYALTLATPTTVHALAFDQGDVDVDVHVLRGDECLGRHDREVALDLAAGTYTIVFDTYAGPHRAGPFQALVYQE